MPPGSHLSNDYAKSNSYVKLQFDGISIINGVIPSKVLARSFAQTAVSSYLNGFWCKTNQRARNSFEQSIRQNTVSRSSVCKFLMYICSNDYILQ